MKKFATFVLGLWVLSPVCAEEAATAQVIRLSEPVQVTDTYEVFGSVVGEMGDTLRLSELIEREVEFLDKEVHVTARVAKVCQKKGCFFVAQDGDAVARVTFVDYSFFVPTDSGGKDVTIVGTFGKQTLSEEKARHYARDEGGDAESVVGPRSEYSIVATSVIVPKS